MVRAMVALETSSGTKEKMGGESWRNTYAQRQVWRLRSAACPSGWWGEITRTRWKALFGLLAKALSRFAMSTWQAAPLPGCFGAAYAPAHYEVRWPVPSHQQACAVGCISPKCLRAFNSTTLFAGSEYLAQQATSIGMVRLHSTHTSAARASFGGDARRCDI